MLKAIDAALPKDTRPPEKRKETEEDIAKRPELHIQSMDCEYFADLTPWQTSIAANLTKKAAPAAPAARRDRRGPLPRRRMPPLPRTPLPHRAEPEVTPPAAAAPDATAVAPPMGDPNAAGNRSSRRAARRRCRSDGPAAGGWVIEMRGYHLHNNLPDKNVDVGDEGEQFVRNTFIKNLETGKVALPDGPNGQPIEVPIAELGIQYPVVVTNVKVKSVTYMAEPVDAASGGMPMTTGAI